MVPLPLSDAGAVDPEEMFVASLASCHMLWFLSLAAGRAGVSTATTTPPAGTLARNAAGRMAMTRVTLRPRVRFAGEHQPEPAELKALHDAAHEACFIASSVTTEVRCEPRD